MININNKAVDVIDDDETWPREQLLRVLFRLRLTQVSAVCNKSCEILFADTRRRRRRHVDEPPPLPGIARCSTLKMLLGVAIGNDFSVSQHVQ